MLEGSAGAPATNLWVASPGFTLTGNIERLSAAERATSERLMVALRQSLRVSEHEGADFVSAAGTTYDAMGTPQAYQFWNQKEFSGSINTHLRKSNDYTVIDLTGASRSQIDAIKGYVGSLSERARATILFVGQ